MTFRFHYANQFMEIQARTTTKITVCFVQRLLQVNPSDRHFFCWDSLNDRWVTMMNTPINTMHSQCFANGQLEIICLHWIYRLTFSYDHLSRLKNKPVRLSRQALHYCEMKSHIILKTEFSLNIVARNLIQRTVNVYFSAVLSLSNQLNVLESFYFSSSCHLYG